MQLKFSFYLNTLLPMLVGLVVVLSPVRSEAQWSYNGISGWAVNRYESDMAFLSNGNPVIAWGTNSEIFLALWNGVSWIKRPYGDSYNGGGWYDGSPKVVIASDDSIFVAYSGTSPNGTFLQVFNGSNVMNPPGSIPYVGQRSHVAAISQSSTYSNPTIYLIYNESQSDLNLYFRQIPSPNIEILIEPNTIPSEVIVDQAGHLHLAAYEQLSPNLLKYGYYDGTSWSMWLVSPGISVNNGDASIVLNEIGEVEIYVRTGSAVKRVVVQP